MRRCPRCSIGYGRRRGDTLAFACGTLVSATGQILPADAPLCADIAALKRNHLRRLVEVIAARYWELECRFPDDATHDVVRAERRIDRLDRLLDLCRERLAAMEET